MQLLKEILALARELLEAEQPVAPEEERARAKDALTVLFDEAKNQNTRIIVERIVADIDEIVKTIRFAGRGQPRRENGWFRGNGARHCFKYKPHTDQALFDRA